MIPWKAEYVYRVTIQPAPHMFGDKAYPRPKRVVPMATAQRVGCILAYHKAHSEMNPDAPQAVITVERRPLADQEWETVEL